MFEFQAWPKIPRYKRQVFVTEKINGSNAQVAIFELPLIVEPALPAGISRGDDLSPELSPEYRAFLRDVHGPYMEARDEPFRHGCLALVDGDQGSGKRFAIFAGSRNRWLTPEAHQKGGDNFGFAKWVSDKAVDLVKLGPGRHYGEWWGQGIQCGYGLTEKRFSLFNTARWGEHNPPPACCSVVPILYQGTPEGIDAAVSNLRVQGSRAAPGFMQPEGVIVYHADSRQYYKITLDHDGVPKSKICAVDTARLTSEAVVPKALIGGYRGQAKQVDLDEALCVPLSNAPFERPLEQGDYVHPDSFGGSDF